jgi:V8-like Glu-specific endopeptidase
MTRTIRRGVAAVMAALLLASASLAFTPEPAAAIIGGHESSEPYSFMGSLQRIDGPREDGHVCGVSLIAPEWGLTAGHCTRSSADIIGVPTVGHPINWQVRFGSLDVSSGGDLVKVEQFVQLNNRYYVDDMALVKFDRPVRATPVPIADANPAPGTPARILGWGMNCDEFNESCFPKKLREADTQIQEGKLCNARDTDLCIGAVDGSIVAGNMDSGGPGLVMQNGAWALVGTVEGGYDALPTLYHSAVSQREWIDGYVSGRTPLPADSPFPSNELAGTVKIDNCSGSLISSPETQPTDPALVLTNGHCASQRPAPGTATTGIPETHTAFVMNANGEPLLRAHTTRLEYATMTGTDVAVYRLDVSYADIAAQGIRPFTLGSTGPAVGQELRVLSGSSGHSWGCTVEAVIPELREGGYTQNQSLRYRHVPGCSSKLGDGPTHGDSGSALVDPATGTIVAIHGTGNDVSETGSGDGEDSGDGEAPSTEPCSENHPCEVDAAGVVSSGDYRYGQQTAGLASCIAAGSTVDLSRPGCTVTGAVAPTDTPTPDPSTGGATAGGTGDTAAGGAGGTTATPSPEAGGTAAGGAAPGGAAGNSRGGTSPAKGSLAASGTEMTALAAAAALLTLVGAGGVLFARRRRSAQVTDAD